MKDKRNCGMNYPVYPPYPGPMVNQGMYPMPNIGYPIGYQAQTANSSIEQKINSMEQQINSLDQRVSRLEGNNTTTNYNKYNDSNYYMV